MNKKNITLAFLVTFLLGLLVFYVGLSIKKYSNPQDAYMVYISGEKIGVISDKTELLNYIDEQQENLKDYYGVDTIYPPTGFKIVDYTTYNEDYLSVKEVYDEINDFSINGYIATIVHNNEDDTSSADQVTKLYVLNKDDLISALDNIVSIFVPEDKYSNYLNDSQSAIDDTGEYINDVYIEESITITQGYINTSQDILRTYEEINQYLLYGTLENQEEYTVKKGDTIESIAYDNGLSTSEFLISNPQLKGDNVLLSANGDQVVNVSSINPLVNVVYETDLVEDQVESYNTIIQYDSDMSVGSSFTKQTGSDGIIKVTFKMQYVNGDIYQVVKVSSSELTPAIDKIVVRGGNGSSGDGVGDTEIWYWPTTKPYKITSYFGYRKLSGYGTSFHSAVDISGCGYGSPIYAANDGIVYYAGTSSDGANTIRIDHQNGYRTYYVHLKDIYVKVGQVVSAGDKIATMGNSGFVVPAPTAANPTAGTHLHFAVYRSTDGGVTYNVMNPLNLDYQ